MTRYIPDTDIVHSSVGTAINNNTPISLIAAASGYTFYCTQITAGNLSSSVDTILRILSGPAERHSIPLPRGSAVVENYGDEGFPLDASQAVNIKSESAADSRFTFHGYKKRN
jgi:hypothetical protein